MSAPAPEYLWWLVVPAILVWATTLVDILRRPGVPRWRRLAWLVAVTLAFPTALLWHLLRPVAAPIALPLHQQNTADPRVELVQLVLARERGTVDQATYEHQLAALLGVRT
jgi:hypothetical protein